MKKSIFYHVGCQKCTTVESDIVKMIDAENLEVVNLGENRSRILEAEKAGVKFVPALVRPNGNVLHVNTGITIQDVKF